MPKIVDRTARKEEFAEAAWRTLVRDGLAGTTLRAVARRAGFTSGALVHYFDDKDELLISALRFGVQKALARISGELAALRGLAALRAVLLSALPLDAERAAEWKVWQAFWWRSSENRRVGEVQRERYEQWRALVARSLRGARDAGDLPADLDVARETDTLLGLIQGLGIFATYDGARLAPARLSALVDAHLARLRGERVSRLRRAPRARAARSR